MEGRGLEVAPGIHRIEAPLGERYVACYLVIGDEAALLVDTGIEETPEASILPYMASIGLPRDRLRWVVATHADVDHMGGDAALKEAVPHVVLVAGEADVELIEDVERIVTERYSEFAEDHGIDIDEGMKAWCRQVARAAPVDLRVPGTGEEIRLGQARTVSLRATAGHSRGSLSVEDPATRAYIVADAVLGRTVRYADGRPAFPPTYRHVDDYRWTITHLETSRPDLLLTSHYPVFRGEQVADFLGESRSFLDLLERELLRELSDRRPRTTRELVDVLAPRVGEWSQDAWVFLANELVGHLEDLEAHGIVKRETRDDRLLQWSTAR